MDWYENDVKILSDAMLKAKEAFDNYINNELNLDGAYYGLGLTGVVKDSDFVPCKKIIMDFEYDE